MRSWKNVGGYVVFGRRVPTWDELMSHHSQARSLSSKSSVVGILDPVGSGGFWLLQGNNAAGLLTTMDFSYYRGLSRVGRSACGS